MRALREILCPRIGTEPLARCRAALLNAFSQAQKQEFRREPTQLWQWIRENIRYVPEVEYRQLITLPAGAVRLRCADLRAQRLLLVAQGCKERPNRDLTRFTAQIQALIDRWEK